MEYNFREIEKKWQQRWESAQTYKVDESSAAPKYYVLDMFPYPSGAGLHVGHPLGYIASDIIARYRRHKGYNVLHPMGFDSFGLPAEQYAIQTGQHPAITTEANIARYTQQLKRLGFNYDWSREVRTSDPAYYRWTQWIFKQLYNSWYNKASNRAESIDTLVAAFAENGTYAVDAAIDRDWYKALDLEGYPFGEYFVGEFTATDWEVLNSKQREGILQYYRLAYLSDTWVNWCEALGTVLANDEVKDGLSERGGYPVEQRLMKQWSLRITAYADRLLEGLDELDWADSIKEMQRNWIGKSIGAAVRFGIEGHGAHIDVFTTRADTLFGVNFMVLAPEHALVNEITTPAQKEAVTAYVKQSMARTERDRQSDVKTVTGCFTGAYAMHPFSGERLPIWIADYVLAGYGTGAVMAVPSGDQRDLNFARQFDLPVTQIFEGIEVTDTAYAEKAGILKNSGFLTGLDVPKATAEVILELEKKRIGYGKVNFRLRDAIFSRQRYWGEPFPVYYVDNMPKLLDDSELPLTLPTVDKYLPTESGEPPLARARKEDWPIFKGERMEYNTMPGWAGSSWYFLRYMDPKNDEVLVSPEKARYWGAVDLYMGGAEHATGHLLYSRFWTKFLCDRGIIHFDEPFRKMINQGMILGRSSVIYRLNFTFSSDPEDFDKYPPGIFISSEFVDNSAKKILVDKRPLVEFIVLHELKKFNDENGTTFSPNYHGFTQIASVTELRVDVQIVRNDTVEKQALKNWLNNNHSRDKRILISGEDGKFRCGHEVEKMSKRWHNVVDPEMLCEEYGADTLRMYEMFLGPVEQSKPWDTQGITGVHNFLRKFWRLAHNKDGQVDISDEAPSRESLQSLHRCIKKVSDELDRFSWNTVVSTLMIAVNELSAQKCNSREVLESLTVLISPYAPHFAEEMWEHLGKEGSVTAAAWPEHNPSYLEDTDFEYPVSFNGKMRFKMALPVELDAKAVEAAVLSSAETDKYLEGKSPKKVIVVHKRIVNVVM